MLSSRLLISQLYYYATRLHVDSSHLSANGAYFTGHGVLSCLCINEGYSKGYPIAYACTTFCTFSGLRYIRTLGLACIVKGTSRDTVNVSCVAVSCTV